jgi:hypothetical protein
MTSRKASHAGTWYSEDKQVLDKELDKWLSKVGKTEEPYPIKGCKALIAPHAGYAYSGPAAAWAYKSIDTTEIKRVFILGPSHHYYVDGCALSRCAKYETPVGELPLDLDTINELKETGNFEWMTLPQDEAEHSIEMHLPYVRKIFAGQDISIVPILVGAISKAKEKFYGSLLAPYLARPDTFFVISSDFCHWGTRFDYTFYYPEPAPSDRPGIRLSRTSGPSDSYSIHESISRLDHEAMDILTMPPSSAEKAHSDFASYLAKTKNTICGRHPIGVLFGTLAQSEKDNDVHSTLQWVRYEQSSPCHSIRDSSVSYASAYIRF